MAVFVSRSGKEGNTVLLRKVYRSKRRTRGGAIEKSGTNLAALDALNAERETPIKIRQNKYLNNVVEQDHRAIKGRTWPMLDFKNFRSASILLSGIEHMRMIAKGEMERRGIGCTHADQFHFL